MLEIEAPFLIFVENTMLLGNSFPMWDPSKGQNRTQKYSIYTPLARGKKMVLIRRDPAAIYILTYGFWLAMSRFLSEESHHLLSFGVDGVQYNIESHDGEHLS